MIERKDDGTFVVYLKRDFTPTDPKSAEMVKIIYPDGRVEIATAK